MTLSKPIKILQVTKLYSPWIGGVEHVVQELSEGLQRTRRFNVDVLCVAHQGAGSEEVINGVRVKRSSSFGIFWGMPVSFSFFRDFRQAAERVDIIHFHEPFPLATLAWFIFRPRKKLIVTYHADIIRQRVLFPLYRPFLFSLLRTAQFICPTSPALQESSSVLKQFRDELHPVTLGIPLQRFSSLTPVQMGRLNELRERLGAGPFLLFVGRPAYYKGLPVLFEALQGISAKLILLGVSSSDVSPPPEINSALIFLGVIPEEERVLYYYLADIFVLPSTGLAEAFGLVQVEAMAAGLPVVNTALPTAVPWVSIHNKTGLTVEPGSAAELREAIRLLLSKPELRRRLGEAGRKRALLFSSERMISAYKSLYESLF